jgi:hypothetical protein
MSVVPTALCAEAFEASHVLSQSAHQLSSVLKSNLPIEVWMIPGRQKSAEVAAISVGRPARRLCYYSLHTKY